MNVTIDYVVFVTIMFRMLCEIFAYAGKYFADVRAA
ncbi:hypothetical protein CA54_21790 [Symmachiella macrocystis]|uniref:Uncharacterized protein n=1 Tax=Symmachiella macrocystis TaxID=2527985 RepID=A0A5C6BRN5_9PLAN|nr:hypothetical protein CA54_21790 [Symmachiella macrocystis]